MGAPTISLCVIAGNEEKRIAGFLESFKDAFDELCLVLALGRREADGTWAIALKWCDENGKACRMDKYHNAAGCDWPHVDSFANARNVARELASGDLWFWADCDDVLREGAAAKIRALKPDADVTFATYVIENTGEVVLRERFFRRGVGRWAGAVHENCLHDFAKETTAIAKDIVFHHKPEANKAYDIERNRRILFHAARDFDRLAFEMHRQYFVDWRATSDDKMRAEAMKWAQICRALPMADELRIVVMLHQAGLAQTIADKKNFAWEAIRLMPQRREGYACLAQIELDAGEPQRALAFTSLLPSISRPSLSAVPVADGAYGWQAWDLHLKAMRACGMNEEADKADKEAKAHQT